MAVEGLRLNLGCGLRAPEGWVNIDGSIAARLSKMRWFYKVLCRISHIKPVEWPGNIKSLDVRKGLPFPNGSAEAIFSSHMLEHMSYEDGDSLIGECYRVLGKGGVIRILVPDLFQMAKKYVELVESGPCGEHSRELLGELAMTDDSRAGLRKILRGIFAMDKHRNMYDRWSLGELLERRGFSDVRQMSYGQSRIAGIELVEEEGRHEKSVCIEGVK